MELMQTDGSEMNTPLNDDDDDKRRGTQSVAAPGLELFWTYPMKSTMCGIRKLYVLWTLFSPDGKMDQ